MGAEHNEPEQKSVDNTKNLDKENKGFIDNTKTFLAGEVKRLKDVITGMEKVVDDKLAQKKEKDYRNVTIGKRYDKLPESTRKTISKEDYIKSETLKERNKELENRGINNYKEQLKNAESLQKFYDTHSFTNNSLILGGIINNEAGVYDQTSKQWVGHAYLNKVGGSVRHPKGAEISNYSKLQSKWDNLKAEQKVSFLTNLSTSIGAADTVITDHAKGIDPTTGATHWLSPMAPIFDASSGGNTQKRTINNKVRYLPNWARANNDAKLKDLQKGPNAILNSDYKEIVLNSNFYFYKGVK
jgi:hypothetical protein